jgi:hypothetical protein
MFKNIIDKLTGEDKVAEERAKHIEGIKRYEEETNLKLLNFIETNFKDGEYSVERNKYTTTFSTPLFSITMFKTDCSKEVYTRTLTLELNWLKFKNKYELEKIENYFNKLNYEND